MRLEDIEEPLKHLIKKEIDTAETETGGESAGARRKNEQLQLEVAFLRMINAFLMKQLRKLNGKVELAMHMLWGLGVELGLVAQP